MFGYTTRELGFPLPLGTAPKADAVYGVFKKLMEWDLGVVCRYAVQHGRYTEDEVRRVSVEYRKFLALTIAHPERDVPISGKVDAFWHTHILFTQDYTEMCDHVNGGYLHHRPAILDGQLELDLAFDAETLKLYAQYFGEPNPDVWNVACCVGGSKGIAKPVS